MTEQESWPEYRKLILAELERIGQEVGSVRASFDKFRREDVASLRTDIALLKFKSAMWGAILGGIASTLVSMGAAVLRLVK